MAFTVSLPFDRRLAADDLTGSRAHVRGLARAGILSPEEAGIVVAALDRVAEEMEAANPGLLTEIERILSGVPGRRIAQSELKARVRDAKAVIRTGEYTPFGNVLLVGGVPPAFFAGPRSGSSSESGLSITSLPRVAPGGPAIERAASGHFFRRCRV